MQPQRDYLDHSAHGGCLISAMVGALQRQLELTSLVGVMRDDVAELGRDFAEAYEPGTFLRDMFANATDALAPSDDREALARDFAQTIVGRFGTASAEEGGERRERKREEEAANGGDGVERLTLDMSVLDKRPTCWCELDDRDALAAVKSNIGERLQNTHRRKWLKPFRAARGSERAVSVLDYAFQRESHAANLVKIIERRAGPMLYAFACSVDASLFKKLEAR